MRPIPVVVMKKRCSSATSRRAGLNGNPDLEALMRVGPSNTCGSSALCEQFLVAHAGRSELSDHDATRAVRDGHGLAQR